MEKLIKAKFLLDNENHEKIKNFSVLSDVTQSEVIRVIIEKSNIKIKTRSISKVMQDSHIKPIHPHRVQFFITKQLQDKLKKMVVENKASISEIVRTLIKSSKFESFKFKTRRENILKVTKKSN